MERLQDDIVPSIFNNLGFGLAEIEAVLVCWRTLGVLLGQMPRVYHVVAFANTEY
jgi:hypothetical protein